MIIYLILGISVLLFGGGVVFIFKAYRMPKEEEKAVPISDIHEIKNMAFEEKIETPVIAKTTIAQHVIDENIKKPNTDPIDVLNKEPVKSLPDPNEFIMLREKVNQLVKENRKLDEALKIEISNRSLRSLSEAENSVYQEKEVRLSKALKNIEELTEENFRLQKLLEKERKRSEEFNTGPDALSIEMEELKRKTDEKISTVEKEFNRVISEKEVLMAQVKEIEQIRQEKIELAKNVQSGLDQIRNLEIELERIRSEQKSAVLVQPAGSQEELNALKLKLQQSVEEKRSMQLQIQKAEEAAGQLKSRNDQLEKREKLLEYELTKRRAQAVGLEQICEDFKLQIEQLSSLPHGRR